MRKPSKKEVARMARRMRLEGIGFKRFVMAWGEAMGSESAARASDLVPLALETMGRACYGKTRRGLATFIGSAIGKQIGERWGDWIIMGERDPHTKGRVLWLKAAPGGQRYLGA